MNFFRKIYPKFITLLIIIFFSLKLIGCPSKLDEEEITTEETKLTTEEEITIKEEQTDKELSIDETNEEYFLDLINNFFNAIVEGNEYKFFSTSTKKIVGTEGEYKKGINVDWHFIIVESHSSWENLKIHDLEIDNNTAIITIIGDRIVEGLEYKNDKVSFKFVKENDEWKIVFPFNK